MNRFFHITTQNEAHNSAREGVYLPQSYATEGFIHASYLHQVVRVANARFQGRMDLVLLEIDPEKLACSVVDENLEGGTELFPHLYGPLPWSAVVSVHAFASNADGQFRLPEAI